MPGQTTVTIKGKRWACQVANTNTEITTGLGGIESIPSWTGVLFDLGAPFRYIQIDMSRMLFPLDIMFLDEEGRVLAVYTEIQPEEPDVGLVSDTGARYFVEVNSGEAEGILPGDRAVFSSYMLSTISLLLPLIVVGMAAVMMVDMMTKTPREAGEKGR